MLSLPVSTLSSHTCVRAYPPLRPFSVHLSPLPLPPPLSLSLSVSVTLLSPRSHRLSLYNDRPALSASLYLPPSAAIAFTTISFYIVTFSACETTRAVETPGRRYHRDATGERTGKGKKKESKNGQLEKLHVT